MGATLWCQLTSTCCLTTIFGRTSLTNVIAIECPLQITKKSKKICLLLFSICSWARANACSIPRWDTFNKSWLDKNVPLIRYEDLLLDAVSTLERALLQVTGQTPDRNRLQLIVEKYKFENQTKRKRGVEDVNSFIRKGIAGDWKNKFTPEARRMFHKHAGDTLIALGYELDNSWVNET